MPKFHSLATSVELSVPKRSQSSASVQWPRRYSIIPGGSRRLEVPPRDRSHDYVLPEESLLSEVGMGFIGKHQDTPFYLIRAGKDLFKTTHETGEGSGGSSSVSGGELPVRTLWQEQTGVATGNTGNQQLATALAPGSTPSTEDQRAESGDGQTPAVNRSSFGRLLKRKSSPSSFSMRISQGNSRSTVDTAPINATTPTGSRPPRQTTPSLAVRTSVQPEGEVAIAPLPLTLTVTLSPPDRHVDPTRKIYPHDVKVDVFLNGEFTGSHIILARHREAGWGQVTESISGRRISTKQERVWVVVPHSHKADGSLRDSKIEPYSAAERWKEIGRALLKESDCWGFDVWGERSCAGRYLEYLAKTVEMPKELEQIQKDGGQKFGVLDVVLSLGKMGERETNYLRAPQRSLDPRFSVSNEVPNQAGKSSENAPTNPTTPVKRTGMNDNVFALQDDSSPYSARTPTGRKPPISTSMSMLRRRSVGPEIALLKPTASPRTPRTPRTRIAQQWNGRISAEQLRRLRDLSPIPVERRPESIPVPIDISLLPRHLSAPSTPDRPSIRNTSSVPSTAATYILGQESSAVIRTRRSPSKAQDNNPVGNTTIVPKKRQHSGGQAEEAPLKKRRSGDDLSTTLSDSIWSADRGIRPTSLSQSPSGEGGIILVNPCHTNFNFNFNILAQQARAGKSGTPRPSVTSAPVYTNTNVNKMNDPFYMPPPEPVGVPWNPGPLDQDSVLTYAVGKAWQKPTGHPAKRVKSNVPTRKAEVVYTIAMDGARETRTEKAAKFEEHSVLMGVRYILA
ncbi:MAG: hypothetical protein M1840_002531 [Geoglossum simile]|nr:MAG: hypothetical protein M1840_002531 [Geoglossum simile]